MAELKLTRLLVGELNAAATAGHHPTRDQRDRLARFLGEDRLPQFDDPRR